MRLGFLVLSLWLIGCANAATPKVPASGGDARFVTVDDDGHFHRADGSSLSENEFRTMYLRETKSFEIEDELAAKAAKRENALAIGIGAGTIAAGSAGFAVFAKSKNCAPSAPVETREACVKSAADAVAVAALGVYVISCEFAAGVDCVRKDMVMKVGLGPAHLNRERAAFFADRYNDAVSGAELEEAPLPKGEPKHAVLTVTPSGLSGRF